MSKLPATPSRSASQSMKNPNDNLLHPSAQSVSNIPPQQSPAAAAAAAAASGSFSKPSPATASQHSNPEEEEMIYMALSACYDDYLKGNKTLMSKIVNEMSNRHKEKEQIRMWLKASTKKVIDLFRNKQDVSYLVEVVLYQMPWFEAGNEYEIALRQEEHLRKQEQLQQEYQLSHLPSPALSSSQASGGGAAAPTVATAVSAMQSQLLQMQQQQQQLIKPSPHFELFSELARFMMTILSFSNAFAPQILKFLVSNIVPMQIKEMEGFKKSEIKICVEGHAFENQKRLLLHIRDLLSEYRLDSVSDVEELSKEDSAFMLGVLKFHPNAKEKLSRFKKLLIGQAQFDEKISRCLYIQTKDGTKSDISYVKSVQNLVDEQFQKISLKQQGSPNQKRMMGQIVDTLVRIIKIYPLYQNDLCRILSESYPHRVQGELFHKIFLTNTLQLAIKYPLLQPKILLFVVQKLLEIDSEIKLEFADTNAVVSEKSSKTSQIMAEKLDWLMLIMFEFIDYLMHENVGSESCFGEITPANYTSESAKEAEESRIFKMFLSVFSESILITHQSKYVQFMLFYLCSLRLSFEKSFLNSLMTNITKKNPLMYKSTQINSIYYLGSFLARAKYVTHDAIAKIFEFLLGHLRDYIDKFDQRQKEVNYNDGLHRIHQNLYHLLQAIMYIICFRFTAFSQNSNESQAALLEKFFDVLRQACDNFNALIFISPSIQSVFCDVCESFGETEFTAIFDAHFEQNPSQSSDQNKLNRVQPLESYFPFDPYCLQYSDKYICEIYQNWQEVNSSVNASQEINNNNNSNNSNPYVQEQQVNWNQSEQQDSILDSSVYLRNRAILKQRSLLLQQSSNSLELQNSVGREAMLGSTGVTSSNQSRNSHLLIENYGFKIDKLNIINDMQYDRDNMLSEDDFDRKARLKKKHTRRAEQQSQNEEKISKISKVEGVVLEGNGDSITNGKRRHTSSSMHDNNHASTNNNKKNTVDLSVDFPSPLELDATASAAETIHSKKRKHKHSQQIAAQSEQQSETEEGLLHNYSVAHKKIKHNGTQ